MKFVADNHWLRCKTKSSDGPEIFSLGPQDKLTEFDSPVNVHGGPKVFPPRYQLFDLPRWFLALFTSGEIPIGPRRPVTFFPTDVHGDEPIWVGGDVVGFVTSGGFAHYCNVSVAIGFLPVALITEGREVEIEILGERRNAKLITEPLFDPKGERMRG